MIRTASTGSLSAVIQQSHTHVFDFLSPLAVIAVIWQSSIFQDSQALEASSHPAVIGSHPAVTHPIYKNQENSFVFFKSIGSHCSHPAVIWQSSIFFRIHKHWKPAVILTPFGFFLSLKEKLGVRRGVWSPANFQHCRAGIVPYGVRM